MRSKTIQLNQSPICQLRQAFSPAQHALKPSHDNLREEAPNPSHENSVSTSSPSTKTLLMDQHGHSKNQCNQSPNTLKSRGNILTPELHTSAITKWCSAILVPAVSTSSPRSSKTFPM